MILTWLWKMLQWFRRSQATSLIEAPKGPGRPGEALDFVNASNDANASRVVIFEGDGPDDPATPRAEGKSPGRSRP
jgi:hypothetical protein